MRRIHIGLYFVVLTVACSNSTGPATTTTHPTGNAVSPAPAVSARPFAVAISSQDVVLVGRQDVPFLQRTNLPDLGFTDSVRVGSDPTDIAFNSSGTRAYVTNQFSGTVNAIDIASGLAIDTIAVPGAPFRILVSPDDATIFVSANDDSISAIMLSSRTIAHRWGFNAPVNGLAVSHTGAVLYVSSIGGSLYKLNTNGTGTIDSVQIAGTPQDVALSPDGAELFLANEGGTLEIRNPASLALVDTVKGGAGAFGLKPTPDGVQVYATYPSSGLIRIVDRATRTIITTLSVGGTPRRIAFGQAGATAIIPNEAGFVTVVH